MESRLLPRLPSSLLVRPYRQLSSCCFVWYASLQSQLARPRQRRGLSSRSTQSTKRTPVKPTPQKHQASVEKPSVSSRAFSRLNDLLQDSLQILSSPKPPSERAVLGSLSTYSDLAKYFKDVEASPNLSSLKTNSAAANLLFLDNHNASQTSTTTVSKDAISPSTPSPYIASSIASEAMSKISSSAWDLVRDPKVFITGPILKTYVDLQSTLSRPETLVEVFNLYASKPIPTPGISPADPVKFVPSNPNKISTAVPLDVATTALNTAMRAENLSLCLDIVERTVCTTSYRRSKFVRQSALPLACLGLMPVAAYSLAAQFSLFQDSMSIANATGVAFAGILAYVGGTATIGVVALTTKNDHMDRVTWASGTPLRERWIREDERAMLDAVAGAWGFKEAWKRGDEEGPEWQALKELVGLRGMVLDRVELMEGME